VETCLSSNELGKKVQFGLSATARFPGFDLAGEIRSDAIGGTKAKGEGEALTGFEALLATLISGGPQKGAEIDIDVIAQDPANQQLADALSGMAEALVPLANAFDNLTIPTADQLDAARAAMGELVNAINAHPNRQDISLKGPIGAFAAQLGELRAAGSDAARNGVSELGKVGQLLGHLDKILNQMGVQTGANGGAELAQGAKPNLHQMIDQLNELAGNLHTLPQKLGEQVQKGQFFGNAAFDAQTSAQAGTTAQTANAETGADTKNVLQAALNVEKPLLKQQQAANNNVGNNASGETDILAQIAKMGEQLTGKEVGALRNGELADGQLNAKLSAEVKADPERMTFAQATKEANLQAAARYPEMQRQNNPTAANAPLTSELDAVETGTEKLFGQHKVEQFQQQVNHIEAAQQKAMPRQINLPAVAFEIVRQVKAGMQRFEVRLDPPEMGRIDVQMEMEGKNVTARLVVERAETLDLLQRDARALERALQQAGLNAERANLQFSLKQDQQGGFNQQFADRDGHQGGGQNQSEADALVADASIDQTTSLRGTIRDNGLNLWV
jgi:flagellar hook-length control protein FliK